MHLPLIRLTRLQRTNPLSNKTKFRMINKEAKEEMVELILKKDLTRKITKDLSTTETKRRLRLCQMSLILLIGTLVLDTLVSSKIIEIFYISDY